MDDVGLIESMERVLVELYPDKGALDTLLSHAEIKLPGLSTEGGYNAVLNRCLRMVEGLGKLDDLIKAAMRDYGNNPSLQGFADRIEFLEKPLAAAARQLRGSLVWLRQCRHLTRRELSKLDDILQRAFDIPALEESDRGDEDIASDPWYELVQKLKACVRQLQLYRELLAESAKSARGRTPGVPDERLSTAELAANKAALIDAKLYLFDAVAAAARSCQDMHRSP